jgi:hypothetical protein
MQAPAVSISKSPDADVVAKIAETVRMVHACTCMFILCCIWDTVLHLQTSAFVQTIVSMIEDKHQAESETKDAEVTTYPPNRFLPCIVRACMHLFFWQIALLQKQAKTAKMEVPAGFPDHYDIHIVSTLTIVIMIIRHSIFVCVNAQHQPCASGRASECQTGHHLKTVEQHVQSVQSPLADIFRTILHSRV